MTAGAPALLAVDLPGVAVRFSTRAGGVSKGAYASLNLGAQTGDVLDRVGANRARLAEAVGLDPAAVRIGHQVHGAEVARWDAPPASAFTDLAADRAEVDGHVTALRGLGLLVQVADCLPVALATRGRVAMVHCGWRGVAAGILARAVAELGADPGATTAQGAAGAGATGPGGGGTTATGPIAAVVGPGIGRCCFEVGPEVLEPFADVADAVDPPRGRDVGGMLDLRRVVEARLRAAGVERVEHVDLCTCCRQDLFFSHRRDGGVTGRQCGIVWRT